MGRVFRLGNFENQFLVVRRRLQLSGQKDVDFLGKRGLETVRECRIKETSRGAVVWVVPAPSWNREVFGVFKEREREKRAVFKVEREKARDLEKNRVVTESGNFEGDVDKRITFGEAVGAGRDSGKVGEREKLMTDRNGRFGCHFEHFLSKN